MLQLFRSNRGVQNFHPDSLNLLNFLICVLLLLTPVIPGEKKKLLCCLMEGGFFSALIYWACIMKGFLISSINLIWDCV